MKRNNSLLMRIEDDLLEYLKQLAQKNRTSVSHEIRQLIIEKKKNEKLD